MRNNDHCIRCLRKKVFIKPILHKWVKTACRFIKHKKYLFLEIRSCKS